MVSQRIALEGAFNFRDLGGVRTAGGAVLGTGRVFRSDGLHRLTGADVTMLRGLGVEQVFDLRSHAEVERDGFGDFSGTHARCVHAPLVEVSLNPFEPREDWKALDLRNRYVEMLAEGGAVIRRILETLAAAGAAGAPVTVFHCTGGKDRTGVVTAVLLRALGVDDSVIVDDYAVSETHLAVAIARFRDAFEEQGLSEEVITYLTSSPPERMEQTLGALDRRWGSTREYLDHIGVGEDVVVTLRANLLS